MEVDPFLSDLFEDLRFLHVVGNLDGLLSELGCWLRHEMLVIVLTLCFD